MLYWKHVLHLSMTENPEPPTRVEKTENEWQSLLSKEAFYVARNKGTERAHSSDMCTIFEPGKYACVCCKTELFDSTEKFDSGTGWPSFTQPIEPTHVAYHLDKSFGSTRIETTCNVCDAHLGHVFPDGPEPSGLRYCINAVALEKV